jgi:hypothetical protein
LVGRLRKQGILHPPTFGAHGPVFTLHCRHAASPLRELRRAGLFPGPCGTAHDTLRTASSESPDPCPDVCRFVTFRCLTIQPNLPSGQDLVSLRD